MTDFDVAAGKTMPLCDSCERPVAHNWVYCPECGVKLDHD